ncbi:uncharacterized protein LOC111302415 [Durio zibethinus]|uniref:Uncharacterized protein LOC111302415 n=1 Tax=Durio zibethinus TaxID=66656 RepID=A0A6P5ZMN0_DURZI|nr:uncharacterized protein LOC111302415 [Durio zibethinus]
MARTMDNKSSFKSDNRKQTVLVGCHEAQKRQTNKPGSEKKLWKAPKYNHYKVNFDGAFRAATREAGIGVVIRDYKRDVLGAMSRPVTNVDNAMHVERLAVVKAIEFASYMGFNKIELEGDALSIIKLLKHEAVDLSLIENIMKEVQFKLRHMAGSHCSHIRRKANEAAHTITKLAVGTYETKC